MVRAFYSQLMQILLSGESVAIATVVATRGSTPREMGAKMMVRRSGAITGTIGGGCGEAQVWRSALQVIETGAPALEFVDLTEEISLDATAVCGGTMDVLIERWSPSDDGEQGDLALATALLESLGGHEPMTLATVVAAPSRAGCAPGQRALLNQRGIVQGGLGSGALDEALLSAVAQNGADEGPGIAALDLAAGGLPEAQGLVKVFIEHVIPPPHLVILGAGHIAIPLSRMAKMLDFDVAVLDDRSLFANSERFPEADVVLLAEFERGIRQLGIDRGSYVVLITRGHQHDVECLKALVGTECAYIGMIGSRRRVRAVFDLLCEQGVSPESLVRVHAPIGVDIGAKTPAEIALSIMAEVVKVRRGGRAASLSGNGELAG